jgi:hypothetical protein
MPELPFAFPCGTLVAEGSVDTCLTSGINSQKGESDRPLHEKNSRISTRILIN